MSSCRASKRPKSSVEPVHARGVGEVFTFGTGDFGQLGLGPDIKKRNYPCLIEKLKRKKMVQVVCGGMHTAVLDYAGTVWTFGVNDDKALGRVTETEEDSFTPGVVKIPKKVEQISAGDSHTAALTEDGRVFAWGTFKDDIVGIFGLVPGKGEKFRAEPVLISAPLDIEIKKIASGDHHLVLLGTDGKIYTCGRGDQGQLGRVQEGERRVTRSMSRSVHGSHELSQIDLDWLLTPTEVQFPIPTEKFVDIWTGSYSTYCKTEGNNEIWVFGLNNYDQLGLKNIVVVTEPTKSLGFEGKKWQEIAAGQHHAIALDENGKVYGLGRSNDGRLGLGPKPPESLAKPTEIKRLKKCIAISAGSAVSYAISEDGELYSWGFGDNHQLGTGNKEDLDVPRKLLHMSVEKTKLGLERKALFVSGGGQHAAVLLDRS